MLQLSIKPVIPEPVSATHQRDTNNRHDQDFLQAHAAEDLEDGTVDKPVDYSPDNRVHQPAPVICDGVPGVIWVMIMIGVSQCVVPHVSSLGIFMFWLL
uniref:Uncharacterized protein n=1 Tax=mine drainage metagenome TaxID=410659 RepID=E6QLT1_9ZZZZ